MMRRIPVACPDLSASEEALVLDAVRSSWISSSGPYIDQFEQRFAAACRAEQCLAVSNGTVALHLALLTLDAGPGDEVIVPSLTYVATANAVRYVGAEPVFVDVSPDTLCIDPDAIAEAITPHTRGIIAVHLYGHPADMDTINRIADDNGLWVIEDAAEAPFATYKGRPIGCLGRIATFSFYGNKVITSGEGGAITLSDGRLAERARLLRGQGMDPNRRYYFPVVGYNFRLTNVACALLCAQMDRAESFLERRKQIYRQYDLHLSRVPGLSLQPIAPWATITPWLYPIIVGNSFPMNRDELCRALAAKGIETRPFFIPLHTLPAFEKQARHSNRLAVSERMAASGLNLPTYSRMTDEDVNYICDSIEAISATAKVYA